MMHKRTLISLLIVSFIVAFAASMSVANTVTIQGRVDLARCTKYSADITANPSVEVSGIELVLEVARGDLCLNLDSISLVWDLPEGVLSDQPPITYDVGVDAVTIRAAAMRIDEGDGTLGSGAAVVAHLDFKTPDCCDGAAVVDNTTFEFQEGLFATTQFVDAATTEVLPADVTPGSIGVANQGPTIVAIAPFDVVWNTLVSVQAEGSDPDVEGCESLKYYKIGTLPQGLTVSLNGLIEWQTDGDDICEHEVSLMIVDDCGAADTTSFVITVTNTPPTFTNCPDPGTVGEVEAGDVFTLDLDIDDPDGGPFEFYHVLSGPGEIDENGVYTWDTDMMDADDENYHVCVSVTDSSNICDSNPTNADTCCFDIFVIGVFVSIDKLHGADGKGVIQGQVHTVSINYAFGPDDPVLWSNMPIAGFDLLIAYDASALGFMGADRGSMIDEDPQGPCGEWEYFTYRQGGECSSCNNACPSGEVRFVGMAEQNDAVGTAACYDPYEAGAPGLVDIDFLVTNNRTFDCQFVPIRFLWCDCGDNTLSNVAGDVLMLSRYVVDYAWGHVEDYDTEFPTYEGAPWPYCLDRTTKAQPWQVAWFFNGGIDIICGPDIDDPGDINVNGVAYEIADAVMFTNYFIIGIDAFGLTPADHQDASIAASDVNKDGIVLSVADLVYLIRVVVGDAVPYPKENAVPVTYTHDGGVVAVQRDVEIGAAYLEVRGQVEPELLVSGMEVNSRFDGEITRIIVTPDLYTKPMASFSGEFLAGVQGEIVKIDMATREGAAVNATNVPTRYDLSQNYPNPFNPTTIIEMAMPQAGAFELAIYNVQGQLVETYSGVAEVGTIKYEWDASGLASGVYLYKLTAGDFSSVKKAVLLK